MSRLSSGKCVFPMTCPRKTGSFKMRVCSCNVQSDSQKRLLSAANAAGEYVNLMMAATNNHELHKEIANNPNTKKFHEEHGTLSCQLKSGAGNVLRETQRSLVIYHPL